MLVNVCSHGMKEECRIFLENLSFSSFCKLMEAARRTSESVQPSSANRSNSNSLSLKRPLVANLEKGERSKSFNLKEPTQSRCVPRQFLTLLPRQYQEISNFGHIFRRYPSNHDLYLSQIKGYTIFRHKFL